ncbi:MAG: sigma 54-interacting transcriptional regulator [Deltaproteobacteria bacterium]|nr:sigma 54-interacting transcriptional regulator [Deltaproteobacteria bacterium]
MTTSNCNNDKLNLLYEMNTLLANEDDIQTALFGILRLMNKKMDMQRGMIGIFNRRSEQIYVEAAYGLTFEEKKRGRYSLGEGITGKVAEDGEPIVVPAVGENPDFLDRTGSRYNINKKDISFICVPIKWNREVIGTLSVDRPIANKQQLEEDLAVLLIISVMISQKVSVHRAIHEENQMLLEQNARLQYELKEKFRPANIIGNSKGMRVAYELIKKVSKTQTSVLILGESGVGKELFAHAIHYDSDRANKPFIKVNCSALPPTLIESELFGHEKGAFTGAVNIRKGRFELADGGTIFLDEIGELSLNAQTKLLRILQEREFERVGGSVSIKVNVRVITATNRNLSERIESGEFREDLFYRLNVFPIVVPPLRQRKNDIPMLINHFIEKYNKMMNKKITRVSTPAIDMLMSYHWPGNVRELENCIERAVIMADENVILGQHLSPTLQTVSTTEKLSDGPLQKQLDMLEYTIIMEELKRCKGNMSKTSQSLGLTNRIMGLRIKKYGIDIRHYKNVT